MKTVLITGASRGIGEAVARAFSANGYNVIINYLSSEQKALRLKDELNMRAASGVCAKSTVVTEGIEATSVAEVYRADVGKLCEVEKMFDFAEKKFGGIDVLVNNAGVALKQKVLQDVTEDELDLLISTNLKGTFNCSKCAVPFMLERGEGRIINLSSIWGLTGGSCEVAYSTVKAGVIGFTKALAKELAPANIAVNAVAPGLIDTDMNAGLSESDKLAFCESVPAGRVGTAEEVARVISLLADFPLYVTGQIIGIDGGFCA